VGGAARSWRRFAAWSAGASSLQGASLAIPAILVTAIYGPAAGGLFVITQRVLGLPVNLVSEAVGGAWSGTAAEIVRSDRGSLRPAFVAVTRSLLLGGGAILAVVLVAGPPLFGPVFGGHWHGGGELILVLAPLHFSLLAAVPAGQTLQARGRTDLLMRVAAARLAAPVLGIAGGHAIGLPLTASLAIYAGAMATISAVNAVMAWRLSV
jgi:O-antigen/teichoic acid export membrane protein